MGDGDSEGLLRSRATVSATAPGLGTSAPHFPVLSLFWWGRGEAVRVPQAGLAIPGHGGCAALDVLGSAWGTTLNLEGCKLLVGPENAGS